MKLLVIRHGPAGDPEAWKAEGRDDRLRPLSPDGKKETRQAVGGLATLISSIDLLATSPLIRATQTADIVARQFGCEIITLDSLLPEQDPEQTSASLKDYQAEPTMAVVGHEPHLSRFITYLLAGKRSSFIELKKGGACLMELKAFGAGKATLVWLLTRRDLARLAD